MIFLLRFLYILSNSAIYINKAKFKEIHSILTNFIWRGGAVWITKNTLQIPILEGGLALPCLQTYYVASQLAHAHWWFYPEANNAATTLETVILTDYESLQNLIHRMSLRGRGGTTILAMTLRIFKLSKLLPSDSRATHSPNTHGCKNFLFLDNMFHSFADFQRDFGLPPKSIFPIFTDTSHCRNSLAFVT